MVRNPSLFILLSFSAMTVVSMDGSWSDHGRADNVPEQNRENSEVMSSSDVGCPQSFSAFSFCSIKSIDC